MNKNETAKKEFEMPKADIIVFDADDVIATSGGFDSQYDNFEQEI